MKQQEITFLIQLRLDELASPSKVHADRNNHIVNRPKLSVVSKSINVDRPFKKAVIVDSPTILVDRDLKTVDSSLKTVNRSSSTRTRILTLTQ